MGNSRGYCRIQIKTGDCDGLNLIPLNSIGLDWTCI